MNTLTRCGDFRRPALPSAFVRYLVEFYNLLDAAVTVQRPPVLPAPVRRTDALTCSHGIVTPRLPQLTPKPVIGIGVADKLLGLGIPLQLATKAER